MSAYGPDRRIASLHIGIRRRDIDPGIASAIQAAGSILAEKLILDSHHDGEAEVLPVLSVRERDALAFVADGKTDWEIATIMGVSQCTARFHVDNARRKLNAVNRAHAVARYLTWNGPL